jgi:hypothetical protein
MDSLSRDDRFFALAQIGVADQLFATHMDSFGLEKQKQF